MKRAILVSLAVSLLWAATVAPAFAQVLYTSGPTSYDTDAYPFSSPFYITDSFDPTQSGTANSAEFVAWLHPGSSLTSVSWSIGTTPDGSDLGSGTVDPIASLIEVNGSGNDIYSETFSLPGLSLNSGDTYYFTLQNGVAANGAFWDYNDNYATGYVAGGGPNGSETFEILTTAAPSASPTPEPSTLLLLATGLLGFGLPLATRARRTLPARP